MCAAELLAAAAAAARDAVTACRGATSVAPARCARACLGTSRAAAAACRGRRGLEACRRAPRRAAAALAIGRVEPPAPTAGAPFTLTVRVVDARGAPVGAETPAAGPVVAIVSAAAVGLGGRGAPLLGARTSAARGDVATFAPLRVDRPGTYVLRVAAAGLAAAAARVTVAPDPLDAAFGASPGGRCAAALVDAARCPPRAAPPPTPPGAAAAVIARVPAGALVARGAVAGCAPLLTAAGFRCDEASWAPRPWVAARAGLLWLEAAAFDHARPARAAAAAADGGGARVVPSDGKAPLERLGLATPPADAAALRAGPRGRPWFSSFADDELLRSAPPQVPPTARPLGRGTPTAGPQRGRATARPPRKTSPASATRTPASGTTSVCSVINKLLSNT